MNTKYLIAVSAFTIVSVSVAQASDMLIPNKSEQIISSIIDAPTFSWEGFYFGGQINGFSSKLSAIGRDIDVPVLLDENSRNKKWEPVEKKYLPKLSGISGGFYAGANVDLGYGFILGVDTDILFLERKGRKTVIMTDQSGGDAGPSEAENGEESEKLDDIARDIIKKSMIGEGSRDSQSAVGYYRRVGESRITFNHTLKQKWTGATRVRVGYPFGYIMPYVSGGIAYGSFQDVLSVSITGPDPLNSEIEDTKTMIGYTLGGGVDFALTDHVVLQAEYRYSDFRKKKFKDVVELDYKTNDFRVGVAYKF
ncbi:outer membrane protein [Bartonella sp. CB178]|uniref:outer membrane protein n=1 Tax=Bartonella sp. CB178 TaxID=3112255 RepID=UPI00300DC678